MKVIDGKYRIAESFQEFLDYLDQVYKKKVHISNWYPFIEYDFKRTELHDPEVIKYFGSNSSILDEVDKLWGKYVTEYNSNELSSRTKLIGLQTTNEDFYYIIYDEDTKKRGYMSCVGGIREVPCDKSYKFFSRNCT